MSNDANNRGSGTPAMGTQGGGSAHPAYVIGAPAGSSNAPATTQNNAYGETGMTAFVDQFAGLGLGAGLGVPALPPLPLVHNGSFGYPPALYGPQTHLNGYLTGDVNDMWVHNGVKWPYRHPSPIDQAAIDSHIANWSDAQRQQLYKYYESIGALAEPPTLQNRRSSYSTNESTPATPFFNAASRDAGTRVTVFDRGSSAYTTPSPPQITSNGLIAHPKGFAPIRPPIDRDLKQVLDREPAIPLAVPAVFTPRENMKTLEQSLTNNIPGNRNVYIRGLHPTTDDDLLFRYAERFGSVETSKAIIDTATGACKGFGFAKFRTIQESEACISGFHAMGYEVGFARVTDHFDFDFGFLTLNPFDRKFPASAGASAFDELDMPTPTLPYLDRAREPAPKPRAVKMCNCPCELHTSEFTNFDPWDQESFNSRLKAEGDEESTNLYISNLPKSITETELSAIFVNYTILSAKILRDSLGNSRGVGFARFESRELCDEIIDGYTGQPLGDEGLPMQIRYADTPAQKELKRITSERRQFRTNEYNVGAYGTPLVGMSPTIYSQPGWKQRGVSGGLTSFSRSSMSHPKDTKFGAGRSSSSSNVASGDSPASENGSAEEGVTIVHVDSPLVADGSSPAKKEQD
ncbi:sporulation-specific protein [Seiridium cupressi]